MPGFEWVIWIATFVTFTLLVYGVMHYASNRRMVRDRFRKTSAPAGAMPLIQRDGGTPTKRLLDWVSSFGKYAAKDKEETYKLRWTLIQAGFRHPKGTAIFFGSQALLAFVLPLPYLLFYAMNGTLSSGKLMVCLVLAGMGFYLPKIILKVATSKRQDRIDKALPDVLDLLIVCMEAGLSLQATLNRVSDEVRPISEDLYHELNLTNAELRTGITRETALRNLAERTGVQNLNALVGMMIQSDRMGSSISQALRVHSDFLRVQRAQKAEEVAAKLPVKILFPMLLFIFPAVFIVILGPAAIQMMQSSFFRGG